MTVSPHLYHLYGLRVWSHWALPYATDTAPWHAEVSLTEGSATQFDWALRDSGERDSETGWFRQQQLDDGTLYLRWTDLFEFLVSASGLDIVARPLEGGSPEAFHTYLFGQALSCALIRQGFEPLHATTVTVDGRAVALLGGCGYGKSSLAAAFLNAGHRLLTDDLLVLTQNSAGGFTAHPGAPRIKLFPEIASRFLSTHLGGPLLPHLSPKLAIALDSMQTSATAGPLSAIYVIAPAGRVQPTRIAIRRLSPRRAFLKLVRNTFNTVVVNSARLERQFALASSVAATVPVKVVSYPRILDRLPMVQRMIVEDLGH